MLRAKTSLLNTALQKVIMSQEWRPMRPSRVRGFEVDGQIIPGRCLHRQLVRKVAQSVAIRARGEADDQSQDTSQ
jgi:hypothetical protein